MNLQFPDKVANYRRLPCLDGLRCISVLLVLIAHSEDASHYPATLAEITRWVPPGTTGVQAFFVLSGFLITFLLLKEKLKHGDVSLKLFYVRRALRILPAYVAFLIVIGIIAAFAPLAISGLSWFALLTYLVNFMEVPKIADHVWSLSVEEQFYLLWPFLFWLFLVKSEQPRKAFYVLLIPVVLGPICRHLGSFDEHSVLFGEHSFFTHFDSLAYGCLLAFALGFRAKCVETVMENRKWPVFIGALLLIFIPHLLIVVGKLEVITTPLASSFSAFGIALLVGFVLFHPRFFAVSWLDWKPVALVGVWSYSIYLWQQIYCSPPESYGFNGAPRFFAFPYWLAPVFATAIASYYLVEKPFLRLKSKVGTRK